ncbi:MAG: hypothetical protein JO038_07250 [Alphaproteobacteria bacterium]|nr:hypothetical protein [Alphaproteobacteria bacterium]
MTVIGVIVSDPGRAVFWADSEGYAGDDFAVPVAKLILNPTAACVGAGTGLTGVIRHADRIVTEATDFDRLPEAVAKVLRAEAGRRAEELQRARRDSFACQSYVVAGFSPSAGRLLAWEMAGSAYFVPTLVSRYAIPYVGEIETARGSDVRDIVRIATAQMLGVRDCHPHATGGALVIAEMAEGRISAWRIEGWFQPSESKREPMPERVDSNVAVLAAAA